MAIIDRVCTATPRHTPYTATSAGSLTCSTSTARLHDHDGHQLILAPHDLLSTCSRPALDHPFLPPWCCTQRIRHSSLHCSLLRPPSRSLSWCGEWWWVAGPVGKRPCPSFSFYQEPSSAFHRVRVCPSPPASTATATPLPSSPLPLPPLLLHCEKSTFTPQLWLLLSLSATCSAKAKTTVCRPRLSRRSRVKAPSRARFAPLRTNMGGLWQMPQ